MQGEVILIFAHYLSIYKVNYMKDYVLETTVAGTIFIPDLVRCLLHTMIYQNKFPQLFSCLIFKTQPHCSAIFTVGVLQVSQILS